MAVSQELVDLLVCPVDHAPIEYKERRKLIICTSCGRHYPVRDNIPVMLVEEATIPPARGQAGADAGDAGDADGVADDSADDGTP